MSKSLTDTVQFRHGAQISSRLVMPPMLTFSGLKGGFVSDDTLRYYHARSQAAGLLIAEYHYVSESGGPCSTPGYPEQLGIYSDEHLEGAEKIAAALQKNGNKAILQIHHGGREASGRAVKGEEVLAPSALDFSFLSYPVREMTNTEIEEIIKDFGRAVKGEEVLAPSALDFSFLSYPVREMTNTEIEEIIKDFGRATKRAIKAGFSGVEIHGANHYLLQQFFSSFSNVREDKWGGSLEKRMAFPLAVVKEVKRVVEKYAPKDFIVGYRISPEEIHGDEVGYTYREAQALIREVIKYELDYIHLSLWGGYASKPVGSDQTYAEHFKSILDNQTKLIIVGGVFSEEDAQDAIAQTPTDLIAVGRGTLIDPLFGQKIKEGRGNEIVHQISPEQLEQTAWTSGLREVFTREDSLGLPELPGHDSITELHTGKYEDAEK